LPRTTMPGPALCRRTRCVLPGEHNEQKTDGAVPSGRRRGRLRSTPRSMGNATTPSWPSAQPMKHPDCRCPTAAPGRKPLSSSKKRRTASRRPSRQPTRDPGMLRGRRKFRRWRALVRRTAGQPDPMDGSSLAPCSGNVPSGAVYHCAGRPFEFRGGRKSRPPALQAAVRVSARFRTCAAVRGRIAPRRGLRRANPPPHVPRPSRSAPGSRGFGNMRIGPPKRRRKHRPPPPVQSTLGSTWGSPGAKHNLR